MELALTYAILTIGAVFVALTFLIVLNKAWRESRSSLAGRRRAVLEPRILEYAHKDVQSLIAVLGDVPRGIDLEIVEDVLLDHVQRVRGVARERLACALDQLGFTERQLAGLRSRRWWVRADAAEKLSLSGAQKAIVPLTRALRDEMPEVRMRAAKALGLLGGTQSIRELILALDDPSRWSTIRIADILTNLGQPMVDQLVAAFPNLGPPGKLAALDILGRVRPVHLGPWLSGHLDDPLADVRARACHALGAIGDPHAHERLLQALEDEAWPVRAMAAKALGRIQQVESIPPLCKALRDDEWWVRSNASRALAGMGRKGLGALESVLVDEDRFARDQAVQMLEQAGVVDEKTAALAATGPEEQSAASSFVRTLIAAGQIGRLRSLASKHPNREVRCALIRLLPPAEPQEAAS